MALRLTKSNRENLLKLNEGFKDTTYYESRNFREQRDYEIKDSQLYIHEKGKTSWSDSRYDNTRVASDEETHRFLYNNLGRLKQD